MKQTIPITYSRSAAVPCAWEGGGGSTNTGKAQVVASIAGRRKRALYVRRRGTLARADHAMVPVAPGDYVIQARHHRRDYTITVLRVVDVPWGEPGAEGEAAAEVVATYDEGEWAPEPPPELREATEAARQKARCYHCREPHYVANGNGW